MKVTANHAAIILEDNDQDNELIANFKELGETVKEYSKIKEEMDRLGKLVECEIILFMSRNKIKGIKDFNIDVDNRRINISTNPDQQAINNMARGSLLLPDGRRT